MLQILKQHRNDESQMKGLIKLYKPDKFPEDSVRNSHFRDRQKLG